MSTDADSTESSAQAGERDALFRLDSLTKHFVDDDSLITRLRPDKSPKNVRAVDGVDLVVREGATLGLVGESGCGKSTLARAALRLIEPTDGAVYYDGDEITAYSDSELRAFRGEAQMIFQDPFASLNPRYTVRKTLTEPMKVHGSGGSKRERVERAAGLLERVGLSADHLDRYPHEFSGGQRQRIAIARALAVEPKLIVADEPTSALDVSVQAQILNLLNDLRREMGLTMLFISHDLSVIRRVTDHVAVMYLGQIVETGRTGELFRDPKHPYTQALVSSIPVPDPNVRRERIPLEGDVPTPIDPPSGCRFHPRCPRVIPPPDWSGTQEEWRRVLQFKSQLRTGEVRPDAIRDQLRAQESDVDDAVGEAIYEEYIRRESVADAETVTLPSAVEDDVRAAIDRLLADGGESAAERLDSTYTTVCETDVPRELELETGQRVLCHLYDPEIPGTPPNRTRGSMAVVGERKGTDADTSLDGNGVDTDIPTDGNSTTNDRR